MRRTVHREMGTQKKIQADRVTSIIRARESGCWMAAVMSRINWFWGGLGVEEAGFSLSPSGASVTRASWARVVGLVSGIPVFSRNQSVD